MRPAEIFSAVSLSRFQTCWAHSLQVYVPKASHFKWPSASELNPLLSEFMLLTKIPIMIFYGDNIPEKPMANPGQEHVIETAMSPSLEELPEASAFSKAEMADAEARLRKLVKSVRDAGLPGVRSTIRIGLAAREIVEVAKQLDADLVVIATRGYEAWKHLVIGSTTARDARAAPCQSWLFAKTSTISFKDCTQTHGTQTSSVCQMPALHGKYLYQRQHNKSQLQLS